MKKEKSFTVVLFRRKLKNAAHSAGCSFSGVDVPKNARDIYDLHYAGFVVPLVKAVQEQQSIIDELKKDDVELKARLEKLATRK